ncbi:tape measure protein [Larkinella terrae]|uniref:Tape measure protein n=1 Tax=Larkinella terrae TaxID=2025311 RepID=A0A7K0ED87_9BACT|nr:tape measure protein [Larkinella terrae]MRS59859.1 tape measure protein [Larkinella terrae]
MAAIQNSDLFNFPAWYSELEKLSRSTDDLGKSLESWATRFKGQSDAAKNSLRGIIDQLTNFNVTQKDAFDQLANFDRAIKGHKETIESANKSLGNLADAERAQREALKDFASQLDKLNAQYKALDPSEKNYLSQKKKIASEVKNLNSVFKSFDSALKVSKSTVDSANGSYNKLQRQTAELWAELKKKPGALDASTGALNKNNSAAVAYYNQITKNEAALKNFNAGLGRHQMNVGNYGTSLLGATGRALQFTASMIGIDSALTALQKTFDLTLDIDSLDASLLAVSDDSEDFSRKQRFLIKTSEELGIEYAKLEAHYALLTANSRKTGLQGVATDTIFKAMALTGGRLKLSNEKLEKGYLALSQMMGKGVISSEELRGQLAEAVPGSVQIMARALGVSTAKLGDMMKAGKVLAEDALPKFAAELEKTFNPNNEKRIEGVRANLARLSNEGIEWIRNFRLTDLMDKTTASALWLARSLRELVSPAVVGSSRAFSEQDEVVEGLLANLVPLLQQHDKLAHKTNLNAKEQATLQKVINQIAAAVPQASYGIDQYGNSLGINEVAVWDFAAAQRELNKQLNSEAIKDYADQATLALNRIRVARAAVNTGKEVVGPAGGGGVPFVRNVTPENVDKLTSSVKESTTDALNAAKQILAMGGTIDGQLRQFIEKSGDAVANQLLKIEDFNKQIAQKQAEAFTLLSRSQFKDLDKKKAEIAKLQKDKNSILNPLGEQGKPSGADPNNEDVLKKSLETQRAITENRLLLLSKEKEEKLGISKGSAEEEEKIEQDFAERKFKIQTLALKQEIETLKKAGDDKAVEVKEANNKLLSLQVDYLKEKRKLIDDKLKSSLDTSKTNTKNALSGLDVQRQDGSLSETEFVKQRYDVTVQGIKARQDILRAANKTESAEYKETQAELSNAQKVFLDDRLDAEKKNWKLMMEAVKDGLQSIDAEAEKGYLGQLATIVSAYEKSESDIKVAVANRQITEEEGDIRIHNLRLKNIKEILAAQTAAADDDIIRSNFLIDTKIKSLKKYAAEEGRTAKEKAAAVIQIDELEAKKKENLTKVTLKKKKDAADAEKDISKETSDFNIAQAQREADERAQLIQAVLSAVSQAAQAIFDLASAFRDRELDYLEKQKEYELKLVGENKEQQARIEEDYDKKQREIKNRQARADKANAMFQIIINTAARAVSAGPLFPLILALGAVQLAAVAATPIPQYKTGKKASNTYSGPALAGEAGAELWFHDNRATLVDTPTIIDTKAGDTILPAYDTTQLIADWKRKGAIQRMEQDLLLNQAQISRLREGRQRELQPIAINNSGMNVTEFEEALRRVLLDNPIHQTIIDEEGFHRFIKQGRNLTEYLDRRYNRR